MGSSTISSNPEKFSGLNVKSSWTPWEVAGGDRRSGLGACRMRAQGSLRVRGRTGKAIPCVPARECAREAPPGAGTQLANPRSKAAACQGTPRRNAVEPHGVPACRLAAGRSGTACISGENCKLSPIVPHRVAEVDDRRRWDDR